MLAFNNKQAFEQIDYIVQFLLPYGKKIKGILAETNGVGKPLVDNLKMQMGYGFGNKIIEWTTSNKSKIEIINALQVAFEQRKIKIMDDERQTAELSMYEAKVKEKWNYNV